MFSQSIPIQNKVDWTFAGVRDTNSNNFIIIDAQSYGVIGDGSTPNDLFFSNILSTFGNQDLILNFPAGTFLFNFPINLSDNIILKGAGNENTILKFDLGGTSNAISAEGYVNNLDTAFLTHSAVKDSMYIIVSNSSFLSNDDWIILTQNDSDLVTSNWALNTVGQIIKISHIVNNHIYLQSPIRFDYDILKQPVVRKLDPVKNIGIECMKILRVDNTSPQQSSNIFFNYTVNSWVKSIESENCTFSHIDARFSSNLSISKSYFHDGFEYGSGGRAYGVMLQSTTNECLIEDNLFKHLRHSMILQSGANGNVFAYNYSFDPFWDNTPNNSTGEIVLHGNYPYANLFENNICQNIVIDNSHGPNGPNNTFFRNRANGYGIIFTSSNSPNQNIIGNEITNTNFPYSLVNYTVQGLGHFIYGNNNKGTIDPIGTDSLSTLSHAYNLRPDFIPLNQWGGIGIPNIMGLFNIPAYDRVNNGNIFSSSCGGISINTIENNFIKRISKIFDILGRETQVKNNIPLFYIYDDGTVEKKLIVE